MSVEGDLFRVTVKGSRESIVKMMNAALKILAHLNPDHYGVDWEHYHSKHPEVEISEDECLAWFNEQKQPWDQEASSRGALRLPAQLFQRASSKSVSTPSTDAPAKMSLIASLRMMSMFNAFLWRKAEHAPWKKWCAN